MSLNDYGREYLLLGLRMDKLIDGFVDSYYGPSNLKDLVENEKTFSPKQLLKSCRKLQEQLNNQGFIKERVKFLEKTLGGIETSLNIISGEKLPFLEKVYRLYDIKPELIDDSFFYNLKESLDTIYKDSNPLLERITTFKEKHIIPIKIMENTLKKGFEAIRKKTFNIFPDLLPESEHVSINLVKDKPWNAYNWYLGKGKSRIDINMDTPKSCMVILTLITHEAYPGHHTEHAIKEKQLYIEQQRFEHSILLIPTPESVISEGIGNSAVDVLFSDKEKGDFILDILCHQPLNNNLDILLNQYLAQKKSNKISNNLAILAHVDGWSDDELVKYTKDFEIFTEEDIRQSLKFIRHPMWSTYIFNYSIGETLIKNKFGHHPSPKDFEMLLTHPILPSDL
ncbi:MAG: hypothetical protein ACFFDH_21150, partial [Promethearchaeota archaeon]